MAADMLISKAVSDTVGQGVSLRVVGTQAAPAKMAIQIAILGTSCVQIQGRLHKEAPWVDIGEAHDRSCLFHVEPVWALRAVTTGTGPDSQVSVWAAWTVI